MKPFPWLHCGAQNSPVLILGKVPEKTAFHPRWGQRKTGGILLGNSPQYFRKPFLSRIAKTVRYIRLIKGLLLFPNEYYPVFVKLLLFQHHAGLQSASIRLAYTVITILSFTWKGFFHHRCCPDHHHHSAIDLDCCNICSVLIPRWCPREAHKPVLRFSLPCSRHIWHSRNSPRDDYGWLHTGYRVVF